MGGRKEEDREGGRARAFRSRAWAAESGESEDMGVVEGGVSHP